jgi:hypothetical protein
MLRSQRDHRDSPRLRVLVGVRESDKRRDRIFQSAISTERFKRRLPTATLLEQRRDQWCRISFQRERTMRVRRTDEAKWNAGFGKGTGADYTPWFTIHDSGSHGKTSWIPGRKIARQHLVLSQHEAHGFYLFQDKPEYIDIREQFPLDKEETIEIARSIGVPHPRKDGGQLATMTTDFVLTHAKTVAPTIRQIKQKKELNDERVLARLEIDRTYWLRRNADWGLLTEIQVDVPRAYNLAWADEYYDVEITARLTWRDTSDLENRLFDQMAKSPTEPLWKTCRAVDSLLHLEKGVSLGYVRHWIARKRWIVDLTETIDTRKPLVVLESSLLQGAR